MDDKPESNKVEKKKKSSKKMKKKSVSKEENPVIYMILCFNNSIWEKETFKIKSNDPKVESIETKVINKNYKIIFEEGDFSVIILKIKLTEKIKNKMNLDLFISSEKNENNIKLGEIDLKPAEKGSKNQTRILFSDVNIDKNDLNILIENNKDIKYTPAINIKDVKEKFQLYYDQI